MRLRICTFNVENLFTRHDFGAFTDHRDEKYLPAIVQFYGQFGNGDFTKFEDFKRQVEVAAIAQDDDRRQHTALAMAAADADIYCLQEVDNVNALERFFNSYVKKIGVDQYDQFVLHEGNDFRGIDVAAIARDIRPITTRSHRTVTGSYVKKTDSGKALLEEFELADQARKERRGRIFRRDCLEIETRIRNASGSINQEVSIFNCHFKSMGGGRTDSIGTRQLEAIAVREIITRKFAGIENPLWAIVGDLNDYKAKIKVGKGTDDNGLFNETFQLVSGPSGLDPLLDDGFGVNLVDQLDESERWTHYYSAERTKSQLDYIIASPALADMQTGQPEIIRAGMPFRVPNTEAVSRYPRVGWDRPKASDHCPLTVEFDIKGLMNTA